MDYLNYRSSPKPKVSIIVPTFNAERHIGETLASLLVQDDCDLEILVMDDGSTDATVEYVRAIDDRRIRLHVNDVNLGLPANMNLGMSLARGQYLARMDHDDYAMEHRFARQARFLDENRDVTVVGGQIRHFGLDESESNFPLDDGRIKARFVSGEEYLANPTAMWRADFVRKNLIAYDANLYVVDDLGVWFDCMLSGARFANLSEVVLRYRIHSGMTSMRLSPDRLFRSKQRIYKRLLPVYFPRLDGPACDALISAYRFGLDEKTDIEQLRAFHQAAALALSEVSSAFGQDVEEVKVALLHVVNRRRRLLFEGGGITSHQMNYLDDLFRKALLRNV